MRLCRPSLGLTKRSVRAALNELTTGADLDHSKRHRLDRATAINTFKTLRANDEALFRVGSGDGLVRQRRTARHRYPDLLGKAAVPGLLRRDAIYCADLRTSLEQR